MKRSGAPGTPAHAREVRVRVRGGYDPAVVRSEVGVPLRLLFHREEAAACSEQVVFPAFGRSATLPQGEDVAVELVPEVPGEYEFTCGMGILRGRLLVPPRPARQAGPAGAPGPGQPAPVEWWLHDDRLGPSSPGDMSARARSGQQQRRRYLMSSETQVTRPPGLPPVAQPSSARAVPRPGLLVRRLPARPKVNITGRERVARVFLGARPRPPLSASAGSTKGTGMSGPSGPRGAPPVPTWPGDEEARPSDWPPSAPEGAHAQAHAHDHGHGATAQAGYPATAIKGHRHGWMMVACSVPMIAIAIALVATGVVAAGFVLVALACVAMMATMHLGMSRASHGGHGGGHVPGED